MNPEAGWPLTASQTVQAVVGYETGGCVSEGAATEVPVGPGYSGEWQTASTLLPSGSRTKAPK